MAGHRLAAAARLPAVAGGYGRDARRARHPNVADLLRLPRAGFVARFGPRLLDELDEGVGRRRRRAAATSCRSASTSSSSCLSRRPPLAGMQPALGQLLAHLAAFLRARAAGRRGPARWTCCIAAGRRRGFASAWRGLAGDAAHLVRPASPSGLARERLPAPVAALRLRSGVLLPLALRDAGLFERGQSADPEATARLLDRLRARLGQDAVFGVCPVSEHRPERAWRIAEPGGASAAAGAMARRAPGAAAVDAGRAAAARRLGRHARHRDLSASRRAGGTATTSAATTTSR